MSKKKLNIKKTIKANINRIQTQQPSKPVLSNRGEEILRKQQIIKKMDWEYNSSITPGVSKQDRAFTAGNFDFGTATDRERHIIEYRKRIDSFKTEGYFRKEDVDYEILICISSYNRYGKLVKLLDQFYSQNTNYNFKIIVLNDGSTDTNYANLLTNYPLLDYYENKKNNGRDLYWYTVTQLWQNAKVYTSNMLMMIDDDFVLGNNFLELLGKLFFHLKAENNSIVAIAPHLHSYHSNTLYMSWWYNTYSCDGVCLFDRNFIEEFDYRLQPVTQAELNAAAHAHGWSQIQKRILAENKVAYKTKVSIAFHNGNDESKLGATVQKKGKANTHYFNSSISNYKDLLV